MRYTTLTSPVCCGTTFAGRGGTTTDGGSPGRLAIMARSKCAFGGTAIEKTAPLSGTAQKLHDHVGELPAEPRGIHDARVDRRA